MSNNTVENTQTQTQNTQFAMEIARTKEQIFQDMEILIRKYCGDGSKYKLMDMDGNGKFITEDGFYLDTPEENTYYQYFLTGLCIVCNHQDDLLHLNTTNIWDEWKKLYEEYKPSPKPCIQGNDYVQTKKIHTVILKYNNIKYEVNFESVWFDEWDDIIVEVTYKKNNKPIKYLYVANMNNEVYLFEDANEYLDFGEFHQKDFNEANEKYFWEKFYKDKLQRRY